MVSTFSTTLNGKPVFRSVKTITERWVVDGQEVKRKKQIKGTGPTRRIAEERLDAAYKRYLVKTGEADPRVLASTPTELALTTGEWLDRWLAKARSVGKIQPNTLVRYQGTIENHIKPHIGYVPIRLLDKAAIERLLYETLPTKRKTRKNSSGERSSPRWWCIGSVILRRGVMR